MNPIAMVEVGVAWRGEHTWQIMQVYIPSNTPEDKIADTAIALARKGDSNNAIAGAWLAHYTHEDFLFAQDAPAPYMTDEEYVEKVGCECPVKACGSTDIVGGETEMGGNYATQEVSCNACGATWFDVYKLIGYDQLCDNSPKPEDDD